MKPTAHSWDVRLRFATDPFILAGTAIIFAVAIVIMLLIIEIFALSFRPHRSFLLALVKALFSPGGLPPEAFYIGGMLGITALFTWLVLFIGYSNRYGMHFELDEAGFRYSTLAETARTNRKLYYIMMFLAILRGRPGLAGGAMVAAGSQAGEFAWSDIVRIYEFPGRRVILTRTRWWRFSAIYCLPENYEEVLVYVQAQVR